MREADALVVMKLGRKPPQGAPRPPSARGSLNAPSMSPMGRCPQQQVMPLSQKETDDAPYFSMIIVHGQGRRP